LRDNPWIIAVIVIGGLILLGVIVTSCVKRVTQRGMSPTRPLNEDTMNSVTTSHTVPALDSLRPLSLAGSAVSGSSPAAPAKRISFVNRSTPTMKFYDRKSTASEQRLSSIASIESPVEQHRPQMATVIESETVRLSPFQVETATTKSVQQAHLDEANRSSLIITQDEAEAALTLMAVEEHLDQHPEEAEMLVSASTHHSSGGSSNYPALPDQQAWVQGSAAVAATRSNSNRSRKSATSYNSGGSEVSRPVSASQASVSPKSATSSPKSGSSKKSDTSANRLTFVEVDGDSDVELNQAIRTSVSGSSHRKSSDASGSTLASKTSKASSKSSSSKSRSSSQKKRERPDSAASLASPKPRDRSESSASKASSTKSKKSKTSSRSR
jgi:hypothetical protein